MRALVGDGKLLFEYTWCMRVHYVNNCNVSSYRTIPVLPHDTCIINSFVIETPFACEQPGWEGRVVGESEKVYILLMVCTMASIHIVENAIFKLKRYPFP